MIKRILLSVSKNPATAPETAFAVNLARRNKAEITGFTSIDPERLSQEVPKGLLFTSNDANAIDDLVKRSNTEAKGALDELGRICSEENVSFHPACASGQTGAALTAAWRFQDLCIIPAKVWEPGVEGHGGAGAVLHLVVAGMRPLIAYPETAGPEAPSKVIVGLSGSVESAKALKHFAQLQVLPEAALHLVTVGDTKSGEAPDELLGEARAFAEAHGYTVTTEKLKSADDRVEVLIAEAERVNAGMFVVGSSYKKLLALERYGKHALGILERGNRPVFISH